MNPSPSDGVFILDELRSITPTALLVARASISVRMFAVVLFAERTLTNVFLGQNRKLHASSSPFLAHRMVAAALVSARSQTENLEESQALNVGEKGDVRGLSGERHAQSYHKNSDDPWPCTRKSGWD